MNKKFRLGRRPAPTWWQENINKETASATANHQGVGMGAVSSIPYENRKRGRPRKSLLDSEDDIAVEAVQTPTPARILYTTAQELPTLVVGFGECNVGICTDDYHTCRRLERIIKFLVEDCYLQIKLAVRVARVIDPKAEIKWPAHKAERWI